MTHPDGSVATRHYQGLLITNSKLDQVKRVIGLYGKTVTVCDRSSGLCELDSSFDALVPLHRLVGGVGTGRLKLSPFDSRNGSARVVFGGGKLGSANPSDITFHFDPTFDINVPAPRQLSLHGCWVPAQGPTTITIEGEEPIVLRDDEFAFIYNYDHVDDPSAEALLNPRKSGSGGDIEDNDFKWVYQLLQPQTGWDAWFKGHRQLPAPQSKGSMLRGADVSTCFGGIWEECPDNPDPHML